MSNTAQTDDGSVAVKDRPYIRIRPSETRLDIETVESHFHRLHELESRQQAEKPWYTRLLSMDPVAPTVEWLLVTDGCPTSTLEYYVGINDSDLIENLKQICRGLFPNDYQFEQIKWHPARTLLPGAAVTCDDGIDLTEHLNASAGLTFRGQADRRRDWQMCLTPFETFAGADTRLPLAAVLETLADSSVPMVYQVLMQPHSDWTARAEARKIDLEENRDTPSQRVADWLFGSAFENDNADSTATSYAPSVAERLDDLKTKDARRSFTVTTRVVATTYDLDTAIESTHPSDRLQNLNTALKPLSNDFYQITRGTITEDKDAHDTIENLLDRQLVTRNYDRLYTKLPGTTNTSRGIIADTTEVPGFCLLDGTALTTAGDRAISTTPEEKTPLQRPPDDVLETYREDGLALGQPLNQDNTPATDPIAVPPVLQPLHVAWFGKTGSGKSTSLTNAIVQNSTATDGADILIDPKGDGMAESYLRAHYATHGTLENVYYFDCTETLPALSFFDIRQQLDDGIDRTTAVENVVDHYIEILIAIMGQERFEQAVRSPDIIRYLLKSEFDPVHGADMFSHRQFQHAASQLHETRDPPPVVDDDLQAMLNGVAANSKRSFDELMQGVANRIEKIPLNTRLGQLFNHVPEDYDEDVYFDLRSVIDEDAVVILDTGGLREESRRVLTLVLLSSLWTALQRRKRQHDDNTMPPLVNLYLEEAADLSGSGLVGELLSQSRSFGLSMTLAMQFPGQLAEKNPEAYAEILNNVSTIVTGNVAVDSRLAERLATDELSPADVSNRLRSLRRGQWFVGLPARFGEPEPRPFLVESLPLPPGHPDRDEPLSNPREAGFDSQFELLRRKTRQQYGLTVAAAGARSAEPADEEDTSAHEPYVDSALPFTNRLPDPLVYQSRTHSLVCIDCETRYDPTSEGMRNAITCCHRLSDVTRESIPICSLPLKLTRNEQQRSPYTSAQLRFLKAVYQAHRQRYDSELEYDLLRDSMIRLQEYVGIERDEVQELIDAGLLRVDCMYPHKLYTVTADGRDVINEDHRKGVMHGDGKGDLSESSLHVMMVELGRRLIEQEYVDDPNSPVTETKVYHELPGQDGRLDAVGLDDSGRIMVTLEAERANNDILEAAPSDYDKMAACNPIAAIWVVKNRDGAHEVLDALNAPAGDGEPRVEKTYSKGSPPKKFKIDQPGFTKMQTTQSLQKQVLDEV